MESGATVHSLHPEVLLSSSQPTPDLIPLRLTALSASLTCIVQWAFQDLDFGGKSGGIDLAFGIAENFVRCSERRSHNRDISSRDQALEISR